jgi:hypothetical protein
MRVQATCSTKNVATSHARVFCASHATLMCTESSTYSMPFMLQGMNARQQTGCTASTASTCTGPLQTCRKTLVKLPEQLSQWELSMTGTASRRVPCAQLQGRYHVHSFKEGTMSTASRKVPCAQLQGEYHVHWTTQAICRPLSMDTCHRE